MPSNRSVSGKPASVAGIEAALLSHLAYSLPAQIDGARVAGLKPNEVRPLDFGRVGDTIDQVGRVQSPHLTQGQADYLNKNFELLDVKDFKDQIHALTVRDRRTGAVTVAFPGTDLGEGSDWGRAITIAVNGEMDATEDAEAYVRDIASKYGPVDLTGHSAGATLALDLTRRLDDAVVAKTTVFQAPKQVYGEPRPKGQHGRRKTRYSYATDDERVHVFQADGDAIGNVLTNTNKTGVRDVVRGGADIGPLRSHKVVNMLNTLVDEQIADLQQNASDLGLNEQEIQSRTRQAEGLKARLVTQVGSLPDPEAWMQDALSTLGLSSLAGSDGLEQNAGKKQNIRYLSE